MYEVNPESMFQIKTVDRHNEYTPEYSYFGIVFLKGKRATIPEQQHKRLSFLLNEVSDRNPLRERKQIEIRLPQINMLYRRFAVRILPFFAKTSKTFDNQRNKSSASRNGHYYTDSRVDGAVGGESCMKQ